MCWISATYSAMLKDRDYDVTPHIILILSLTLTQNARGVGERLRGGDGRRRVLVLTGHAGRVAPISPMLKRRISGGLEILN